MKPSAVYITVLFSVTWEANVNPSRILPEYAMSLFESGTKTKTFVIEQPSFLLSLQFYMKEYGHITKDTQIAPSSDILMQHKCIMTL